jgi:hypothetical protein
MCGEGGLGEADRRKGVLACRREDGLYTLELPGQRDANGESFADPTNADPPTPWDLAFADPAHADPPIRFPSDPFPLRWMDLKSCRPYGSSGVASFP